MVFFVSQKIFCSGVVFWWALLLLLLLSWRFGVRMCMYVRISLLLLVINRGICKGIGNWRLGCCAAWLGGSTRSQSDILVISLNARVNRIITAYLVDGGSRPLASSIGISCGGVMFEALGQPFF